MTVQDKARALIAHPAALGWALGYKDFTPELHGKWLRLMLTAKEDITLQAHRGSYKTTCLCVAIALLMMKERGKNIIFLRKTDNDVAEVVQNVDRILQSPVMQEIYLALTGTQLEIVKSTNTEITTSAYNAPRGSAQLLGIGIGGSLTGKHADIIITDDIVNLKDRQSRAERDRTKAVYMELQNVKNRGGRIINTGTPWHKEDCFTLMPEPMKFDCYQTGLLSKEQIEDLRLKMAPSLFAANYELVHIAAENALFTTPPTFITDKMAQKVLGNEKAVASDLLRDGMAHIDAAYGGEDYTAFTCGKRVGDKLYMYGRTWQKHVDTVLPVCIEEAKRLMCAPILNEDNGDKGYLGKEIKRLGARPAVYHESENKYIKISSYLRKWWPNIVWLEGTDKEYLNQIMDYTEDAEHDDACLAGDTLIATLTGDKLIKDIKTGEYVITPAGIRKVLFAGVTGYKAVQNYHGLFATPDHKIFDKCNGTFSRADRLTCAASYDIISLKELIIWKTRLLCSMAKPMSEIQRADITSSAQQEIANVKMQSSYTEPSGNIITGQSRKGITYITLMVMSIITTLVTWSVYKLGNTCRAMQRKILKIANIGDAIENSCLHSKKKQKNGTGAKPGQNGTGNTHKNLLPKQTSTALKNNVNSVAKRILGLRNNVSALKVAVKKQDGAGLDLNSNLVKGSAKTVGDCSPHTMSGTNFVVSDVNSSIIPVYNLTVEKAGCYYANGILVSNCDSAACIARYYDRRSRTAYKSPFGGG